MKILALIPARGGSKNIPRKNILKLNNHPLIAYSIVAAKLSKKINRIIVTTDDKEIADIAKKYGAEVPFLRPKKFAKDTSLDIEFVKHALKYLQNKEKYVPDLIVHLSPVAPLRNPKLIDSAISIMIKDNEATSLRSGSVYHQTAYKLTRIKNGYWDFFGSKDFGSNEEYYNFPRQILPKTYIPNGYVDIIVPKTIKMTDTLHGSKIKSFITEETADIDNLKDLEFAKKLLKTNNYSYLIKLLEETKNELP